MARFVADITFVSFLCIIIVDKFYEIGSWHLILLLLALLLVAVQILSSCSGKRHVYRVHSISLAANVLHARIIFISANNRLVNWKQNPD
jgi:hypothetical protein